MLFVILVTSAAFAQDIKFLRIGTGGTGGIYFPIGGLIANAISNPPGSRDCEVGGSCGVPGLIVAAVSTQGSVENVKAVASGQFDMALTQADVAYYAYFGKGGFSEAPPLDNLRAVANLYPEALHIVTRKDLGITSVKDLKGKRLSLGEKASGTLVVAKSVLSAYGLSEKDVQPFFEKLGKAGDMLVNGSLDAFFMVGGYPMNAITHTAGATEITLVPIDSLQAEAIVKDHPFLVHHTIPEATYGDIRDTNTLSVGAQIVVSASMDTDLVYRMTRALWHPNNRNLFDRGHSSAHHIRQETALDGIVIPLHPGATKYYDEVGLTRASVF